VLDDLSGVWAQQDDIAEYKQLIRPTLAAQVGQDGAQCRHVAVDVSQNGESHLYHP
jgi:hypothetical protein